MIFDRFAALLEYPTASPGETCAAALIEGADDGPEAARALKAFADAVRPMSVTALQELYGRTFDFDAETALYVGHHLFGEEGRRGLLIAGLAERYGRLALETGREVADHFVPVLRSLACDAGSEEAQDLLHLALGPAVAKVRPNLERRASCYAPLLRALEIAIDRRTRDPLGSGAR